MEVKLIKDKEDCCFGSLGYGETFAYEDRVYVVIEDAITESDIRNNAYCFDNGRLTYFFEDEIVIPVYVEVIARIK